MQNAHFVSNIRDSMLILFKLWLFKTQNYFAFNLRGVATPYGGDIIAGITSKKELTEICTSKSYSAGFVGEFESDKRSAPSQVFNFFISWIMVLGCKYGRRSGKIV